MLDAIDTIDKTDIATAKDIAYSFGKTFCSTDFTSVDSNICSTEDIAIRIVVGDFFCSPVVESSTTTKDIFLYMAAIHYYMCLASLVFLDGFTSFAYDTATASDSTNLATTIKAVAHMATIHFDICNIYITISGKACTKDVTGTLEQNLIVRICHVEVWNICSIFVTIAHITII